MHSWPSKADLVLLLANVVGAGTYLLLASYSWAITQERGLNSMTAEPFIWGLSVVPIWTLFLSIDLIWGTMIALRKRWRSGRIWLLASLIWLVAATIDFAHH